MFAKMWAGLVLLLGFMLVAGGILGGLAFGGFLILSGKSVFFGIGVVVGGLVFASAGIAMMSWASEELGGPVYWLR